MIYYKHTTQSPTGFALLLALVVVSVIVSIGLTVLDLTMKQVRLSTNSKDSEIAFHAANASLECARYWRIDESVDMEAGAAASVACFEQPAVSVTAVNPTFTGSGTYDANVYETQFTWGPATAQRCSHMQILVIVSDPAATTTVSGMDTLMPGYPRTTKYCEPGARCTVISTQGYSKACSGIAESGTVQREVLLEL